MPVIVVAYKHTCRQLHLQTNPGVSKTKCLVEVSDEGKISEREALETAEVLGIDRSHLWKKMKRYGIEPEGG